MNCFALLFAGFLLVACRVGGPTQGKACVVAPAGLEPLLVGDSARLATARIDRGRCVAHDSTRYAWMLGRVTDSAIVRVTPAGWIVARRPGAFRVDGRGDTLLQVTGFVLPRGWRPQIVPSSAIIWVGDTLSLEVRAIDTSGGRLPPVPFSVATPDDIQFVPDGQAARPHRLRTLDAAMPGGRQRFVAEHEGTLVVRGYIGSRADSARVVIRAGAASGDATRDTPDR